METRFDQKEIAARIEKLIFDSKLTSRRFAIEVGIDTANFSRKLKGTLPWTVNDVNKISEKLRIRKGWLLNGEGEICKAPDEILDTIPAMPTRTNNSYAGIPLIPVHAMAGALSGDSTSVSKWDVEDWYIIPSFKKSDFCIRVDGDSMEPRYCRGDILACTRVPLSSLWFQWGKVYILDTRQGALVKHVEQGSDKEHIKLVSDNPEYQPFEIHTSELFGVAIVNGLIRVE